MEQYIYIITLNVVWHRIPAWFIVQLFLYRNLCELTPLPGLYVVCNRKYLYMILYGRVPPIPQMVPYKKPDTPP